MLHLRLPEVIRRPRETEVRATCGAHRWHSCSSGYAHNGRLLTDACMTSIFSSSWMCRTCGREACFDCFAHLQETESAEPAESRAATPPQRERHHRSPFFLPCTNRNRHHSKDFSPVTRFCGTELAQAITDMEILLAPSIIESSTRNPSEDRMHDIGSPPSPASLPSRSATGDLTAPILPSPTTEPAHLAAPLSTPPLSGTESPTLGITLCGEAIPSHDTTTFSHIRLTEEVFRELWSTGDPLVVTGVLEKFQVQWTPEYFRSNYGHQRCTIVECQSETMKEVTVDQFFSWFGNYENRSKANWKLKVRPRSVRMQSFCADWTDTAFHRTGRRRPTSRACSLSCTTSSCA